ncbi:hypothetical protein MBRA1_003690 [Malassezia brasiliensis]|uniref:EF-hand domain-containing protein n=1 Tax=Malassezia brasiliensis TaxID=1821822 RepID=A0AAF0IUJ7_9BASI|nr:hypothetical protein MBRA1_003690 [Malassezia brasiliensis]
MEGRPGSAGAEASTSGTAEKGAPAPAAPAPAAHAQRLSFEQFRAQEPPQTRLLRLRGLFDLLLDRDSTSALAGGRAKQYWRRHASRARYGAGGSLATGSLVAKPGPVHLTSDGAYVHPSETHESVSPSNYLREWFSNVRRQSYANELLAQCRTCHAEMERTQRKMHEEQEAHRQRSRLGRLAAWWAPADKPAPRAPPATRAWYSLVRMAPERAAAPEPPPRAASWRAALRRLFRADDDAAASLHRHLESGWKGSRVWGLSATEDQAPSARKTKDTHSATPGKEASRARQRQIDWEGFLAYAEFQERELYRLFHELDTNHDGVLDPSEIRAGFERAGIHPSDMVMRDFVASLASSGVSDVAELRSEGLDVRFPEFRDYLLLMPRKPTMQEIFRFYQVRKAVGLFGNEGIFAELGAGWGKTERGASAVTLDGDVSLAGEEQLSTHGKAPREARAAPPPAGKAPTPAHPPAPALDAAADDDDEDDDDDDGRRDVMQRHVALKFLLAGGIAGAVSRTATAPLDRLKVFLMTSQETQGPHAPHSARVGFGELARAFGAIYREGGLRGFWLGNGLNCIKIFPVRVWLTQESAIKFFSYETSKRMFAKYLDNVSDARDISGFSRFMSGGIGGITSQLAIYPIETLKTRLMSSQTAASPVRGFALLAATARTLYTQGGFRAYYRGLGAGLVGVFPYSAIDMSTFEGIKLFYLKYTHKEDPGVIPLLMFGSISGSVGASTVYPLNLIRTRLQASGTPAHPRIYTSFFDAAVQTYRNEGPLGFYRGLIPSLAKVVPAVSISYVVYEQVRTAHTTY